MSQQAPNGISQLSEAKRQLFERYMRGAGSGGEQTRTIPRLPEGSLAPLSYGQEQVWLHSQFAPETPLYNEPVTIRRQGSLDRAILQECIQEIVRRHESLRTCFLMRDGRPVQQVQPFRPEAVEFDDLVSLPAQNRMAEAYRLATLDARRSFDLERGPLWRARLVRLAEDDHRLFLTLHHIIFDGVSLYRVFLPELTALYGAFTAGKRPALPPLAIQYADYAAWQRRWVDEEVIAAQMEFWKKELAGPFDPLNLPFDHPPIESALPRGRLHSFALSSALSEDLRAIARNEGVTLFTTLAAAFQVLLMRLSGDQQVCVGTPVDSRPLPETQPLFGYFLNTIVLRARLEGDPTFRQFLDRTREVTLAALSHSNIPFNLVVNELRPARDSRQQAFFRALIALEPGNTALPEGWSATPIDVDTGAAKFDLTLVVDDKAEGLGGRLIYNANLLEESTATRWMGYWKTLLEGIVSNPNQTVSRLPLLTHSERQQVTIEWNRTQSAVSSLNVLDWIQEQTKQNPDTAAAAGEDKSLSYLELDRRSNQIAHRLVALGAGKGSHVALCVDRSPDLIAGLLGILKAGSAYVPLDPEYPAERLGMMIADSKAGALITESHHLDRLGASACKAICLGGDDRLLEACPSHAPEVTISPDDVAYLIYTSGSTGRPKAVTVTHSNFAYSTAARKRYYTAPMHGYILLPSIAFDSSVACIFHALACGGTIVIPKATFAEDMESLAALVAAHQVTHWLSVPSLYRAMMEQSSGSTLKHLQTFREVVMAGEVCEPGLVELHHRLLPQAKLYNEYGPTEATVWCSVARCEPGMSPVPVGKPIANARVYVLSDQMQPQPVGVAGEIYVAGEGVARGYFNQPALSAERFMPDPFFPMIGARMYRTGDRGRLRPDGNLEFLGRMDTQIKLRGYRIEPSEIEAGLLRHPAVQQACVVLRQDLPGDSRLVAYIQLAGTSSPGVQELGDFLRRSFPSYLIPALFVRVAQMPRNGNGKLDRNALPAPHDGNIIREAAEPSGSAVESRVAAILGSLLGVKELGPKEDFFLLGGHSLLATQAISRIRAEFGVSLNLRSIFASPTAKGIAVELEKWLPQSPAGANEAEIAGAVNRFRTAPYNANGKA